MGRKPKLTKKNWKYKSEGLTIRKILRIREMATGRKRVIFERALKNKSSTEIEKEKIILSESIRNKKQPVTSKTIRSLIKELSKEVGIEFNINALNLYSQRKRIFRIMNKRSQISTPEILATPEVPATSKKIFKDTGYYNDPHGILRSKKYGEKIL